MSLCSCGNPNCVNSNLGGGLIFSLPSLLAGLFAGVPNFRASVLVRDRDGKVVRSTGERKREEILVSTLNPAVDEALQMTRNAKAQRDSEQDQLAALERSKRILESDVIELRRRRHLAVWELNSNLVNEYGSDKLTINDDHGRLFFYQGNVRVGEPLNGDQCSSVIELDAQLAHKLEEIKGLETKIGASQQLVDAYHRKAKLCRESMMAAIAKHHTELSDELDSGAATLKVEKGVGTISRTVSIRNREVLDEMPEWREGLLTYVAGVSSQPLEMAVLVNIGNGPNGPIAKATGTVSESIPLSDLSAAITGIIRRHSETLCRGTLLTEEWKMVQDRLDEARRKHEATSIDLEIARASGGVDLNQLEVELLVRQGEVANLEQQVTILSEQVDQLADITVAMLDTLQLHLEEDPNFSGAGVDLKVNDDGTEVIGLVLHRRVDKKVLFKDDPRALELLHEEYGDQMLLRLGLDVPVAALPEPVNA